MTIFSVNVQSRQNLKEFTRQFTRQIWAELYILEIDHNTQFDVTEYNFSDKYSTEELLAFKANHNKVGKEAKRLEIQARERTNRNLNNPEWNPCEICGKKHRNYHCCEQCNYGTHHCHFCGVDLGHTQVSECYIMEPWGD